MRVPLFDPRAAISRRGRADVYYNICVRAIRCGECALNSPPSQPVPRRRSSPAPAQRHALPEHFRSPMQRRCTLADCAMHSRRPHDPFLAEGLHPPPHSDTPAPSTSAPPRCADARPPTARCIPRRPHNTFPAEGLRPPTRSDTPSPSTPAPPRSTDARPQAARCIPRRPHSPFLAEGLLPSPHSDTPVPNTSAPPRSADARPPTARCIPRRPHNTFPAEGLRPHPHSDTLPFRSASGTKKTAPHSECAMPNVLVDRRCGRSFGLVSRALFAAVAGRWRVGVGLRPQPWALRSRRCGRVLRA